MSRALYAKGPVFIWNLMFIYRVILAFTQLKPHHQNRLQKVKKHVQGLIHVITIEMLAYGIFPMLSITQQVMKIANYQEKMKVNMNHFILKASNKF